MELNKIDLNKLNTFLAVVEHSGIKGASEKLSLTRSAISQSVTTLESALDVSLFNRVGKKLILTHEGRQLYENFRGYQGNLQRVLNEISTERQEVKGLIRIGSFFEFSRSKLTRFLAAFMETHPKVQIRMLHATPAELSVLLQQNRIDLAFSIYPERDTRFENSTRLFAEELVLVSSPKYYRANLTVEELMQLPIVDYFKNSLMMKRWVHHHYKLKCSELNVRAYAASADIVLNFITSGVGIGVVPRYLAQEHVERGNLFIVSPGTKDLTDYIWLNELKSQRPSYAYATLKQALLSEFECQPHGTDLLPLPIERSSA